jgi:hypothetical protein|tara:strand:+ start:35776 stop:37137 length:1362 start_codon:yes stop_codon:yes gene_type:complete
VSKSILEKALLEAEQLEQTMKSNAKEILSSTMKKEIHELVKESLDSENDYLREQEEEEEVEIDIEDEMAGEPEIELSIDDEGLSIEDEVVDDELSMELPPLDLTLASDTEVLKVFKAMGDEDGIIIQKDGDEIDIVDNNTNTEYLIKLDESEDEEEVLEMDDETELGEEYLYEIELDDEEEDLGEGTGVEEQFPEPEDGLEEFDEDLGEGHQDMSDRRHERQSMRKHYGENPDGLNPLSGAEQGYDDREDESLSMLHNEDDDVESEEVEVELGETSRLKAGPNSSFSRMAGQKKTWGSQKESRRPRKANLGESRIRKSYNLLKEEVESMKVKNGEYKKALVTFRDKLNEVGVFNSNLAYVTRLFTEHSTTKQEKINILKRFDSIDSLKSSKGLYKVIKEELTKHVTVTKPTKTIAESVENKITKSPTSGGKLLETKIYENPQFSRMKDLMSKL